MLRVFAARAKPLTDLRRFSLVCALLTSRAVPSSAPSPSAMLHIYNTLTRRKEPLRPLEPGRVRMYVCGMTVYDFCHLGHARVLVVFDIVYRHLKRLGLDVTYVRNITDIDDKIIRRAVVERHGHRVVHMPGQRALRALDRKILVLRPDAEPRATLHMAEILAMITRLLDQDHAYVAGNGDVYYAVASFPGYGKLSGKDPQDVRAGARVEVGEAKRDPLDFALWKAAKPGEPAWASPSAAGWWS